MRSSVFVNKQVDIRARFSVSIIANVKYDKLKNNQTEFNLYYQKYNVGEIIPCDDKCKNEMLCTLRYNDIDSYNECLTN